MEFRDFTVEILAERDGRFEVRVASRASGELQVAVGLARSVDDLLAELDSRGTATRAATGVERGFTPDPLPELDVRAADVGQVLFDMLFSEPETSRALAECMTDARNGQAGVRLKLTMNTRDRAVANLARLPWELLHDDSKYKHFGLRPDFPIVRYLEVPKPFAVGRFTPPLRILAVSANPRQDLALDRERDNLTAALGANPDIDLAFVERATIQEIAGALTRASAAGRAIHVVHYMGHGDFHDGRGVLLLHKEGGGEDLVEAEAFATALQAAGEVRLVFLNACNTAQSAGAGAADPFAGVATSLVFEGVPAVVAMQRPVPDAAAIVLARDFYAKIANGWPVDAAVSEGRRQMFFADRATPDWAIPVLFMRSPDGVLFDRGDLVMRAPAPAPPAPRPEPLDETPPAPPVPLPTPAPPRPPRTWIKLGAAAVGGAALVVVAVVMLAGADDPASMLFQSFQPGSIATGDTIEAHVTLTDANGARIQGEALGKYAIDWVPSQAGAVTITPVPVTADSSDLVATIRADKPLPPNTPLQITATLAGFELKDSRPLSVVASEADRTAFLDAYREALRVRNDPAVDDAVVAKTFADLQASRGWVLDHFPVMNALSQGGRDLVPKDLEDTVTQIRGATDAIDRARRLPPDAASLADRTAAWDDASIRIEAARPNGPAAAAARTALADLRTIDTSQPTVRRLVTCTAAAFSGGTCRRPESRVATGQPVYLQVVWRTPPAMKGSDRLRFEWGTLGSDSAFTRAGEIRMDEYFAGRDADRNWWGVFTAGPAGSYEIRVHSDRHGTFVWREKVTVS